MSRHSGAFFGADDVSSLPLHNDPHVGINMSGLDLINAQHQNAQHSNPAYPPSPSSMRSPHSSHGHASNNNNNNNNSSSSNKFVQSPNSLAAANYTSPRLHNNHAAANYSLADPNQTSERYSFDIQHQQHHLHNDHPAAQAAGHRNDGLGRSLSMGHSSHPSQSRSASNLANQGSAMYLSAQSGALSSGHGSNGSGSSGSYLSSLSPSGMRNSSFISSTTPAANSAAAVSNSSATSPQASYSGLPPLSSASSHPMSLLPAPQMLTSPYSNSSSSSRRSSNAMDTSTGSSSARDAPSTNPYSPNTSASSRFGFSDTTPNPTKHDSANLMDVSSPRDTPTSPQHHHHHHHHHLGSNSGLGDLSDSLPYAYQSSHANQYAASSARNMQAASAAPRSPSNQPSAGLWPSSAAAQAGRNSMILDSSSRDSAPRNSSIYSDASAYAHHGLGLGPSPGMMTTASDNSRTSNNNNNRRADAAAAAASARSSRRNQGFRRVRDFDDLRPIIHKSTAAASGAAALSDGSAATAAARATTRRADPAGGFVSPLKALTAYLHHTYHLVNPAFFYELSFNPRRVLTKGKPVQNDGRDNEDSDYILYVNDWLGTEEGHKYLILDILGQGTFGQVVKCQDMTTHEIVAVKVIKNKPAYFNQSMMEVTVLEMLNGNWDPQDEHHILRLKDTFIHAKHLCLVLELLSSNLYELIKQNSFQGLSTSLVRVFTAQLLDALTVLNEARLIHCDLKPENILLKTLQTPSIKLVDFGSACHEKQTVYTYIQSRFYRSPEVLLGLPYNSAIDMWSLGCIAVELFLGLPLFPGTSEYNQICRIVDMFGLPPQWMLDNGKQTQEFFGVFTDEYGRKSYRLKSIDQYSKEHNVQEQPSKKYFKATTLSDIVKTYPMSRKSGKSADVQKEMANRSSFIDFVTGLLNMNPHERWTPQQAKLHPFITGEKFSKPFRPPLIPTSVATTGGASSSSSSSSRPKTSDAAKHPYGGLVGAQQSSSRPSNKNFQDAAAYNQHLAQQQAYHSAAARQQAQPLINNPYAREEAANAQAAAEAKAQAKAQAAQLAQMHQQQQQQQQQQSYNLRHSMAVPPSAYYDAQSADDGGSRQQRSDQRLSMIPPQLAKLGLDASMAGAQNMASMVNRDDPLREWERRQNGLAPSSAATSSKQRRQSAANYQQLDLLQQQAELGGGWDANMLGKTSGSGGGGGGSSFSVVVDGSQDRLGQPRKDGGNNSLGGLSSSGITQPPAAYGSASGSGAAGGMGRYQGSGGHLMGGGSSPGLGYGMSGLNGGTAMAASHSGGGANTLPFDIYDAGMANLLPPSLTPVRIQDREQGAMQSNQQQQFLQQLPLHQQQQYAAQLQTRDKQRRDASGGSGGMMGGFGL